MIWYNKYLLQIDLTSRMHESFRSYHIFYQLIRSADTCKIEWGTELTGKSVEDFYYTAQGECQACHTPLLVKRSLSLHIPAFVRPPPHGNTLNQAILERM